MPVDSIASVIEVKSTLSKEELKDAVSKVASVKKLRRSPVNRIDQPVTFSDLIINSVFGVVFAYTSSTSLETLANNLKELNGKLPRSEWTDLVVVLDKGTLGYYVQYPGEEGFLGQIMPPADENAVNPPYYVHLSIAEDDEYALNKFIATLMAQLTFFRRRSAISLESILRGSNKEVKAIQGYWFDTEGNLQPVPEEQIGNGPAPNWSLDVFLSGTRTVVGRYTQYNWSDGYVYQVIPCSQQGAQILGAIASLNQTGAVHVVPSQDQQRGFTSVLSGTPPSRDEVKAHVLANSKGLEIKWYD